MTGHRLEVADVLHAHQDPFLQRWGHALSDQQRKVLRDIGLCRTAALGTHLERCDRCSYETLAYDSCRNRHCPKCQSSARDRWLLKHAASLLPVPYAHVVFTVPEQLGCVALHNRRLRYSMLFAQLRNLAGDCRRSAPSGCMHRHPCCSPYLESKPPASSASALSRSPPADSRSIARSGSQPNAAGSSSRYACSAGCFEVSCSAFSSRAIVAASYASPASSPIYPRRTPFTRCFEACNEQSGWFTPSLHSVGLSTC